MYSLSKELKRFKGQPIEVIMDNGMKFCGIDVEADDESVVLIDDKGRSVFLVNKHIDTVIEPKMTLKRLCKDNDCGCCDDDDDDCRRNRNRKERRCDFDD